MMHSQVVISFRTCEDTIPNIKNTKDYEVVHAGNKNAILKAKACIKTQSSEYETSTQTQTNRSPAKQACVETAILTIMKHRRLGEHMHAEKDFNKAKTSRRMHCSIT